MKNLLQSIKLTLAFCVVLGVCYVAVLWVFAQVAGPNKGNADVVMFNQRVVGADNVGQLFTQDIYFWGRPSHAGDGYDASSSSGSNKGPTNSDHLAVVSARIDTFLVRHPYLSRKEVPAEMVTASASGLDPHLTPASAYVQARRVATARGISEEEVTQIIAATLQRPLLGLFGTPRVNVLRLNVALDEATAAKASQSNTTQSSHTQR